MSTIWDRIKESEGEHFLTAKHHKRFRLVAVSDNELIIKPECSGKERNIEKEVVKDIYKCLRDKGSYSLKEIRQQKNSHNASYLIPLLALHPKVSIRTNPVKLVHKSGKGARVPRGNQKARQNTLQESIEVEPGIFQTTFWQESGD